MLISLKDDFEKYSHEEYFSTHIHGSDKKYLDLIPEKSLKLSVIPPSDYMSIKSKMDYTSSIIIVGFVADIRDRKGFKAKNIGIVKLNDNPKEMLPVNIVAKNFDMISFEYDLKPNSLDLIIKPVIDTYYDDLDNIYFGCHKEILFDLYVYLRDKNFKILMPLTNEDSVTAAIKNEKENVYKARNKFESQQKLF